MFFLFYGEKGRGAALSFMAGGPCPPFRAPWHDAWRVWLNGEPEKSSRSPQTPGSPPHQPEAASWLLSPTTSWWPRPGGCVKQIVPLRRNWQPAGRPWGRPCIFTRTASGSAARSRQHKPQSRQKNKIGPPPFLRKKDSKIRLNKPRPRKGCSQNDSFPPGIGFTIPTLWRYI